MTVPNSQRTNRTEDLVDIQQLLAKYAVTITQGDVEGLVEVFTPDGTYSAFGSTYTLARFPELVAAAPSGLFMTGTSLATIRTGRPARSRCASSSTPRTTCASGTTATSTCAPTTGGD